MRRRENSLHLRLTDAELALLKRKSARAGLKPQAFILAMLNEYQLKEKPDTEFYDVLKNLRQINLNINQIAAKANSIGFIDTAEYCKNVEWLQREISELKTEVMT